MPRWSTEDVIEMALMHAGYEADQCIATGASIKEVIILEPHVYIIASLSVSYRLCWLSVGKELINSLAILFFVNPDQSTYRLSVSCSLCV